MGERFGRRIAWGVAWTALGRGSTLVMNVVVGVTVTRMLTPDQIGLVTTATVCAGFADVFGQIGLLPAIVQRDDLERRHLDTAFWTDNTFGAVWGIGFAACAPLIVAIYDDPRLLPLLLALSVMFPITALSKIHLAQLQRDLEFRRLANVDMIGSLLAGGVAMVSVLLGAGVWAIILRVLLTRLIVTALTWNATRWLPRWFYDRAAFKELFAFSGNLFAAEVIVYASGSVDRLVMARIFGTDALGYYSRAMGLVVQPLANMTQVLANVLFPSLSRIQRDIPQVRSVYVRVVGMVALVSFPMAAGLIILADDLVVVVLGETWLPAAPFVRILSPLLLWRGLMNMNRTVFKALGRADLMLRVTIAARVLTILITLAGIPWGPIGMAWGCLIGAAVGAVVTEAVAGRLIDMRWLELAKPLLGVAACTALMGLAVYGALDWAWNAQVGRVGRILLGLAVAAAVYPLVLALLRPSPARDLVTFGRQWWARRRAKSD